MRGFRLEDMGADVAAVEQFGPYLVYERLGVGGMATVHRALERGIEGFERIVALKRLLPQLAADASFIRSFVREAKLASVLNHVNIVQIFQLGRVGTQYFISMEYIDGHDIRRILRHARRVSGPPPIHVTVGLLIQLCEALDYAHHKLDDTGLPLGLVHRDVSPSNVLVTSAGQVKVIDFGIAKAQSSQLRTQTGRVKGKLAYMAPEALAGRELDARSDLFAAGVIAHELLTARPLFAAKNEYQTLMKVQRSEVLPPSTFNPSCPRALDALVLRALAREPDERFRQAGELRDELYALRKQYNLQTSDRDIAMWIEWAFRIASAEHAGSALDVPAPPRERPSRPRRPDDDEVGDLAWGGHDDHASGDPVVLDDVPDVSGRHLDPSALGAEAEVDDLPDDMPTPVPSHGRPTVDIAPRTVTTPMRPRHVRQKSADAAAPRGSEPPAPALAVDRSAEPTAPAGTVPPPTALRGDDASADEPLDGIEDAAAELVPSRARTISLPPRALPAASQPPRNVAAALPPHIAAAEPSRGVALPRLSPAAEPPRVAPRAVAPAPGGSAMAAHPHAMAGEPSHGVPIAIDSPSRSAPMQPRPIEPLRAAPPGEPPRTVAHASGPLPRTTTLRLPPASVTPAVMAPRSVPAASEPPRDRRTTSPGMPAPVVTAPPVIGRDTVLDLSPAVPAAPRSLDDIALASDTVPTLPAFASGDPIVRFRDPALAHDPRAGAAPVAGDPRAPAGPASQLAATSPAPPDRLATPATALFAGPDTAGDSAPATATTTAAASAQRSEPGAHAALPDARARRPWWRPLGWIAALALLAAVTRVAAVYLTQDDAAELRTATAPIVPVASRQSTVRFEVRPADASITIRGKPVHAGSPWRVDLEPGVYQIEIGRDGYMGWLTSIELVAGQTQVLHVALEPLNSAVRAEATLIVGSTPPGLEILLDGTPVARTPGKLAVAAGRHRVALRARGNELWNTDVDARATAMYEFHPAIAAPGGEESAPSAPSARPEPPAARAGSAAGTSPAPSAEVHHQAPPASPPPPGARPRSTSAPSAEAHHPSAPASPASHDAAPVIIAEAEATRIAGEPPQITPPAGSELPAELAAKLCIDTAGRVTRVDVTSQLSADVATQLVAALKAWQYAPYTTDGVPRPACFPVVVRLP